MGQSIVFAFTICLKKIIKQNYLYCYSLISAFAFTYVKHKSPNANHKLNCQLYYLLWKWMETKTNRYVFHEIHWLFWKHKFNFKFSFQKKMHKKIECSSWNSAHWTKLINLLLWKTCIYLYQKALSKPSPLNFPCKF